MLRRPAGVLTCAELDPTLLSAARLLRVRVGIGTALRYAPRVLSSLGSTTSRTRKSRSLPVASLNSFFTAPTSVSFWLMKVLVTWSMMDTNELKFLNSSLPVMTVM